MSLIADFRWKWILIPALVVHYCVFLGMVIWGNPENEVSVGLHEPTGPCNAVVPIQTAFGSVSLCSFGLNNIV